MKPITLYVNYTFTTEVFAATRKKDIRKAIQLAELAGHEDPCLTIDAIDRFGAVSRIWSCFKGVH
jgi:hypothetical protein